MRTKRRGAERREIKIQHLIHPRLDFPIELKPYEEYQYPFHHPSPILHTISLLVKGPAQPTRQVCQYGIRVSFWGSGTLRIVIYVEIYPQKRCFRLDDYHPPLWWGVLISGQYIFYDHICACRG